jgi:hypothetical protein
MRALWFALCLLAAASAASAAHAAGRPGGDDATAPAGALCGLAIQAAQDREAVPTGLLFAIGQVESGRPDSITHRLVPWPWTVQAQGQSHYFATKAAAVAWVQAAQTRGIQSIDVGCMQVNLMYHPAAFPSLDDAFDPGANANYAARFLVSLHATTGDWQKAAGLYHSQSLALAVPYAQRVEDALNGRAFGGGALPPPKPTMLAMLQAAWGATLDTPAAASPAPAIIQERGTITALRERGLRRHAHSRQGPVRSSPVLLSYEH